MQYYDIRKKCVGQLCYDFSHMENLLNKQTVRDALGVGHIEFVSCSSTVYEAMLTDWMRNLEVRIPTLLEDGIKMLVYAGEYDLICNWLGNLAYFFNSHWNFRFIRSWIKTGFGHPFCERKRKRINPLSSFHVHKRTEHNPRKTRRR